MDRYLAVMAGAALGGLFRYLAATWINTQYTGKFPMGTFLVNVTGCFLIGLAMTILTTRLQPHANWNLFLVTGILGGYTTFSTFGWETVQASRAGLPMMALANAVLSVVAGYAAVWCGIVLARK